MFTSLDDILSLARERDASDVILVPDEPPVFRINGHLIWPESSAFDAQTLYQLITGILTDTQRQSLEQNRELDFSHVSPRCGRFRLNLHYARGALAAAVRVIADHIPTLDELGLPQVLADQVRQDSGLLIITGPTGSGKTTTLAALVGLMNQTMARHIITIEDPVEYYHANVNCIIEQREVGSDTPSFRDALRHLLRQDPDVIVLGEMRDIESIAAAVTAAETGHLVLGTLHTNDAAQTVHRIIDAFPADQQNQIRAQLTMSLHCVVSQRLIPTCDGSQRVAAIEIMIATPAVRNLVRNNELGQLRNVIATSSEQGMRTLDQSIQEMYEQGVIDQDEALARAIDPRTMSQLMKLRP